MILSCWWSNIPDAWSELRFCSFMGWVARSVTWSASVPRSLMSTTCTMEAHFCVVYSFSNTRRGAENRNERKVQHFSISETVYIYILKAFPLHVHVLKINTIHLHFLCSTHVYIYKHEQWFGTLSRQQELPVYCCMIYRDIAWSVDPAWQPVFTEILSRTGKSNTTEHFIFFLTSKLNVLIKPQN